MQFTRKSLGAFALFAAATALVVACGDDDFTADDDGSGPDAAVSSSSGVPASSSSSSGSPASSSSSSGSSPDAGDASDGPDSGSCDSTVALVVDPAAEATARAALAVADPGATGELTWNARLGTLQSLNFWNTQLPDCTGDADVYDALEQFLLANSAIFQIDPTEWKRDGVLACKNITDLTTLHLRRQRYGQYGMVNDVFNAVVSPIGGVLTMRNYSGPYLPKPSEAMQAALAACPDKPVAELVAPLSQPQLGYHTFAAPPEPICTIDGDGDYTKASSDALTIDDEILVQWEEGETTAQLHRERTATVLVDPANYTDDLVRSDANCIDLDGGNHIGWIRHFDPGSGHVLFDHPTPDPSCVVCLQ